MADVDPVLHGEARTLALQAAQRYIESILEGQVVTGYVLVVESIGANSVPQVNWATGNGDPVGDDFPSGLAAPRIFGMLRIVDIDVDLWCRNARGNHLTTDEEDDE